MSGSDKFANTFLIVEAGNSGQTEKNGAVKQEEVVIYLGPATLIVSCRTPPARWRQKQKKTTGSA